MPGELLSAAPASVPEHTSPLPTRPSLVPIAAVGCWPTSQPPGNSLLTRDRPATPMSPVVSWALPSGSRGCRALGAEPSARASAHAHACTPPLCTSGREASVHGRPDTCTPASRPGLPDPEGGRCRARAGSSHPVDFCIFHHLPSGINKRAVRAAVRSQRISSEAGRAEA